MAQEPGDTSWGQSLVAVVVDMGSGYGRAIFRGVSDYALADAGWQVVPEMPADLEAQLRAGGQRAGVILQSTDPGRERFLKRRKVPVVNVSNYLRKTLFPRVATDDAEVGRLGAQYFLERGFREAAWCGAPGIHLSATRQKAFVDAFRASGGRVAALDFSSEMPHHVVRAWLASLPRPCALMAFNDQRAIQMIRLAREAGLRVPEDLAVLGVDDDELASWRVTRGLSSVRTDGERVGYLAAVTLDALRRRERVPVQQLVQPSGLATRGSTDLMALGDPVLNRALRLIRSPGGGALLVDEVARHAGVSRRVLEMRFRKQIGRTVLGEIIRQRIELAARLLRETNLSIEEIANKAGYGETRQLSGAFRKAMGCSPREYRKRFALGGSGVTLG